MTSDTVSIFVLVDALGWDYIKSRPFLNDIAPYRKNLTTILGYSSGAIPAILTGVSPARNGHWNLFYYDPLNSPFKWARPLGRLPSLLTNNPISRRLLNWVGHRVTRFKGYFFLYAVPVELLPYFSYCETRDIFLPGGVANSSSIFDVFEKEGVPFRSYTYHQYPSDQAIVDRASEDLSRRDCQVYFLYLNELDMFLHRHCHEPGLVDARIAIYDRWLRALYGRAVAVRGKVNMYVFSDHGMVPTQRTHDLWSEITGLGFKTPDEYLAFYDSTMARFWFFDERARRGIRTHLERVPRGHILTTGEMKDFGLDFADTRYGELVFLMEPGCLISPSYLGKGWIAGMHGYHPEVPFSDGTLVSTVVPPVAVSGIQDVFQVMRRAVD